MHRDLSASGHPSWVLTAPPQPLHWGTHHSKLFLVHCAAGVRVIVHTANFFYGELNNKTQGIWWQDFPPKVGTSRVLGIPVTHDAQITGFQQSKPDAPAGSILKADSLPSCKYVSVLLCYPGSISSCMTAQPWLRQRRSHKAALHIWGLYAQQQAPDTSNRPQACRQQPPVTSQAS